MTFIATHPNMEKTLVCRLTAIIIVTWVSLANGKEFATLDHIQPSTSTRQQTDTLMGLLQRLLGPRAAEFTVTIDPAIGPKNRDTFKLVTDGDTVHITGTSGGAAGWGLYYYLSQYCGCHVSWAGDQLKLPVKLPHLPAEGVTITSNDKFRYYSNVVTVGYSYAWWDWDRWERELDWMVLNGYNLALAFQGQEEIWRRVYTRMGLTKAEIDNHIGGPPFLPWSRMGNEHGWGGPVSTSWHTQQVALQHKILERMRGFGITPVTPAFAGHVPNGFSRLFPNSSVTVTPDWAGMNSTYCCTHLLSFDDPQFAVIGKSFLREYIKEFGTDHVYNTDTFNELQPKSSDPAYLQSAGKAVFNSLLYADPQAIWLMQGWLFFDDSSFWKNAQAKALLTSVPQGRMIVLDLFSEVEPQYKRLDSYFGQPYIWCMLQNFGGRVPMYGVIDAINEEPFNARKAANSSMVGTGLTPEGINQNNMMFEFMNENAWRTAPRNLTNWMINYATRRYGLPNINAAKTWQLLTHSVYNCTDKKKHHNHNAITTSPSRKLRVDLSVYNAPPHTWLLPVNVLEDIVVRVPSTLPVQPLIWYDPNQLYEAWDNMLLAADALKHSQLYRYDLVDVSRQSLQIIAVYYYNNLILSYNKKDLDGVMKYGTGLTTLISDLDELLGSDSHFLLGAWLESAKALATSDADRRKYEYNARMQITLWGTSHKKLKDYANKQWSGLVKTYYLGRWKLFVNELETCIKEKRPFNASQFEEDLYCDVEEPFTLDTSLYPIKTSGDQIDLALKMHQKYRQMTVLNSDYFKQLRRASSHRKKFVKYMNQWLRANANRDMSSTCKEKRMKLLRHKQQNVSVPKVGLPIKY